MACMGLWADILCSILDITLTLQRSMTSWQVTLILRWYWLPIQVSWERLRPQLTLSTSRPFCIDYELIFFILNQLLSTVKNLERDVDENSGNLYSEMNVITTTVSCQHSIGSTTMEQFLLIARVTILSSLKECDGYLLRKEFYCSSNVALFHFKRSHEKSSPRDARLL